nr:MAG TPA_asm: hypothetical protein [Caudoviricetes sp.]
MGYFVHTNLSILYCIFYYSTFSRFCIDCGIYVNFDKRHSEEAYLFSKIHLTIG